MGFRRRTRRRALIAGAAIAHHRNSAYADQQAQDQAPADDQGQTQYAPPPDDQAPAEDQGQAAAGPPSNDMTQQIEQFAQLHASGALTDEEFAAAKAKALGL